MYLTRDSGDKDARLLSPGCVSVLLSGSGGHWGASCPLSGPWLPHLSNAAISGLPQGHSEVEWLLGLPAVSPRLALLLLHVPSQQRGSHGTSAGVHVMVQGLQSSGFTSTRQGRVEVPGLSCWGSGSVMGALPIIFPGFILLFIYLFWAPGI